MLFGHVKMKFNYGYKYVVENEPKDFCQNFLTSSDNLIFEFFIEFQIQPRYSKNVHTMQVVFHPEIFIPFHFHKILHHQLKGLQIFLSDHFLRDNFLDQSFQQASDSRVVRCMSVQFVKQIFAGLLVGLDGEISFLLQLFVVRRKSAQILEHTLEVTALFTLV